jgi:hypothetical protein
MADLKGNDAAEIVAVNVFRGEVSNRAVAAGKWAAVLWKCEGVPKDVLNKASCRGRSRTFNGLTRRRGKTPDLSRELRSGSGAG